MQKLPLALLNVPNGNDGLFLKVENGKVIFTAAPTGGGTAYTAGSGITITGTTIATTAATTSAAGSMSAADKAKLDGLSAETYSTITTKLAGGSGGGTTNFLRADGTFAAPPAGSGGGGAPTDSPSFTGTVKVGVGSWSAVTNTLSVGQGTIGGLTMSPSDGSVIGSLTAYSFRSTGGGVGYATGAGGTVTQTGSAINSVTINKLAGRINLATIDMPGNSGIYFTVNNSVVTSNDTVIVNNVGNNAVSLIASATVSTSNGAFYVAIRNADSTTQRPLAVNFTVIKGATS